MSEDQESLWPEKPSSVFSLSLSIWRHGRSRRRWRFIAALTFGFLVLSSFQAQAASRLKDVVDFEGVRDNMLIGYGLWSG
jgi:type VI protein secretion system component VasA